MPRSGRETASREGRRPRICGGRARTGRAHTRHSKVFGQAFFKKLAERGAEPRKCREAAEKQPAEKGRRPRICGGRARTGRAHARHSKVFGQAFFKKLAERGAEPRNAAQRQKNSQQRGGGGPESAAGARTQAVRTPGTVKFLLKLFSKSLRRARRAGGTRMNAGLISRFGRCFLFATGKPHPSRQARPRGRAPRMPRSTATENRGCPARETRGATPVFCLPPVRRTAWQRIFLYSL